jgi:hypothetical protein
MHLCIFAALLPLVQCAKTSTLSLFDSQTRKIPLLFVLVKSAVSQRPIRWSVFHCSLKATVTGLGLRRFGFLTTISFSRYGIFELYLFYGQQYLLHLVQ